MIGDSASNGNAIAVLILGTILTATLSAIYGMFTMNRALAELDDDTAPDCSCGDSWCPYTPNKAQKAWWRP